VSNVIDFLQRLGTQGAELRLAPRMELEQALADGGIDPALREALLAADQQQLESLLGADTNVYCMMAPQKKDEDEEEVDEDEEEDDDEDEDEDDDEDFEFEDDEDDEDEDEEDEDEDEDDEEEENSLTPRRSIGRRVG
jgi:hypothetical protein